MKTIHELLEIKGRDVWSIGPDALVYDAIALMAEKHVGALMVLEDEALIGVISERDYARKVILQGKSSKQVKVREIMASPVIYTRPEERVDECMAVITNKRIRHLPVLAEGKLIGVISIGDLVKAIISEQEFIIEQLEHYISGSLT
jgi:CBS domain-containing protein